MNNPQPVATQVVGPSPTYHAPRSRAAAFFDWVLGTRPQQESTWARPIEPDIVVAAPSERGSWVDSFHAALTEAATRFIVQHVEPYHREDPSAGFAVTRVKVGFKDATAGCLHAIESMPADMRDRIVLLRIKKAKGAEQLVLDHFYGLSILAEETLIGGQLVETLVSYSNSRFVLKFEFEGEYCTLPQVPEQQAPTHEVASKPVNTDSHWATPGTQTSQFDSAPDPEIEVPRQPVQNSYSAPQRVGRDTPLYQPPAAPSSGSSHDTPLYRPTKSLRKPVMRLHLAVQGSKTVVELFEDGFPYTIGRHAQAPGFVVRPCNGALPGNIDAGLLAHTQTPETICYVSRDHLVLNAPDLRSAEICVDNLATKPKKNGTFVNGREQPLRFIHPLNAQLPLCLGGSAGDGILELRLERA